MNALRTVTILGGDRRPGERMPALTSLLKPTLVVQDDVPPPVAIRGQRSETRKVLDSLQPGQSVWIPFALHGRIREALCPELQVLRDELVTLRAQNYETQSLLAGAEAERDALRATVKESLTVGSRLDAEAFREERDEARALLSGVLQDIRTVQAECDALRADAERWRFVAAQMTHEQYGPHVGWTLGVLFAGDAPELAIDAAIDAVREAGK